jgi:hypothetical protein
MRINRVVLLTVLLLLATNIGSAKGYEEKAKVGGYDVVMKIDRNPPIAGDNHVSIEVADPSGRCVCDVDVIVEYSRAAMGGMPALYYKADTVMKSGRYTGTMRLPTAGPWNIAVKIIKGEKTWLTNFTVDVE